MLSPIEKTVDVPWTQEQSFRRFTDDIGRWWPLSSHSVGGSRAENVRFEGKVGGNFWAQTRPLGDLYFAYPPGSEWRAGPSINLATSPDALHWRPYTRPGIRPHASTVATGSRSCFSEAP